MLEKKVIRHKLFQAFARSIERAVGPSLKSIATLSSPWRSLRGRSVCCTLLLTGCGLPILTGCGLPIWPREPHHGGAANGARVGRQPPCTDATNCDVAARLEANIDGVVEADHANVVGRDLEGLPMGGPRSWGGNSRGGVRGREIMLGFRPDRTALKFANEPRALKFERSQRTCERIHLSLIHI